jgi:hypothetical protein
MFKIYPYLLCLFFLSVHIGLYAQEEGTAMDTIIQGPYMQEGIHDDEDFYQDNSYFQPRLAPSKVSERRIEEEKVLAIKAEDEYWYADLEPKKDQAKKKEPGFFQSDLAKTLFWILITGGFVALLIWFLASGNISLFRRKARVHSLKQVGSTEEEDIFSLDYEMEIQKAINANDYRYAIRLMYLQVMKEMAERNIIKYSPEKTNSDYLFQLFKSRYYQPFFTLTRHFDYTWYGHFQISPAAFRQVQNDFSSFKQQLN